MTPEYLEAVNTALAEDGTLLVTVICAEGHGRRGRCGEVRASSLGPILVTSRKYPPFDQWIKDKLDLRAKGIDQGTVKPFMSTTGYLFDHPHRESPTVSCRVCGTYTVDEERLREAVADALRSGPTKHVVERVGVVG